MSRLQMLALRAGLTALALSLVTLVSSTGANSQIAALQSFSGGTPATSGSDQLYGWEFNVLSTVDVTALGVYDYTGAGLSISHAVGIYRTSDQSLLTSDTVPVGTGGTLDGGFRYIDLGSSVVLTPDSYVIVMTMPTQNTDYQYIEVSSETTAPQIQYTNSDFDNGSSLAFPTQPGTFGPGIFGPNFEFTATTPEPGPVALLGSLTLTGAALLRRRRTRCR